MPTEETTTTSIMEAYRSKIGTELGVSEWIRLTQADLDPYADLTEDRDWFHNDPERTAREGAFGGRTIAQGNLPLAQVGRMAYEILPQTDEIEIAMNYGFERVRYIRPVPVDSRIRGRMMLKDIRPKGEDGFVMTIEITYEVEGEEES